MVGLVVNVNLSGAAPAKPPRRSAGISWSFARDRGTGRPAARPVEASPSASRPPRLGSESPDPSKKWSQHSRGSYRSEEHTSELQSRGHLVCRPLLEKKNSHMTSSHLMS